MHLINRDSRKRPTGLTPDERVRICSLLQTKVGEYNKANAFLAEVLRATISEQKSLFPKLHLLIQQDNPSIYDAHALFYGIKLEMAKGQEKLLKNTRKSMEELNIEVKNGIIPLLREYVVALQELAFKYRELNGTVDNSELLNLLQEKRKGTAIQKPHSSQPDSFCVHDTIGQPSI